MFAYSKQLKHEFMNSKSIIKTQEQCLWHGPGVFIVNFRGMGIY